MYVTIDNKNVNDKGVMSNFPAGYQKTSEVDVLFRSDDA
jgi:hypothetical protein